MTRHTRKNNTSYDRFTLHKMMIPIGCIFVCLLIINMLGKTDPETLSALTLNLRIPLIKTEATFSEILTGTFYRITGFDFKSPVTIVSAQIPVIKAQEQNDTASNEETAPAKPTPPPAGTKPIESQTYSNGNLSYNNIAINNQTSYDIDIASLLSSPLEINQDNENPLVLIVHTHTTESYTFSGVDSYAENENTRTTDPEKNVIRVGRELEAELEKAGIKVVHDETINDYPSYNGSYTRTLENINALLEKYPSIQVVIDLHRDAIQRADGTKVKVSTQIEGKSVAQCMIIAGSNEGGLPHDNWKENLSFALKIQNQLTADYPKLARPLMVVRERYNQHTTKGSIIVEVGTDGNTLDEAIASAGYFGKALAKVLAQQKTSVH